MITDPTGLNYSWEWAPMLEPLPFIPKEEDELTQVIDTGIVALEETASQVDTIAKKEISKTETSLKPCKKIVKATPKRWTEEEDEVLRELYKEHGKSWNKIAAILGGRDGKGCRQRYVYTLDPHIDRTPWSKKDFKLLKKGIKIYGLGKWDAIAKGMFDNERTGKDCFTMHRRHLAK